MRVVLADPLVLPSRVDPVGFLLEWAEAWAMGKVAAAGLALDIGSRRGLPDEEGLRGLAATLTALAIDAPRLVERVETATQWGELEDAAEEALRVAEVVLVPRLGGPY